MKKQHFVSCGVAALLAGGLWTVEAAQNQNPAPAAPAAQASADRDSATTVTGCLYREQDIPGRTPNVAEKAGVLEDYILVEGPAAAGAAPQAGAQNAQRSSASARQSMYKVEHVDDEDLDDVVGKRVEVTGRVDMDGDEAAGTPGRDNSIGPDQIELPEFEATSIREVPGTCPGAPSAFSNQQ